MQERLDIRSLIHDGRIDEAIQKVKELDPEVEYLIVYLYKNFKDFG